jgi:hypothetical protein
MDAIDRRVLAILAENPRGAIIRDEEEKQSLAAMALYIWHPVSDVYELPDGSLTGRITEAGRAALASTTRE